LIFCWHCGASSFDRIEFFLSRAARSLPGVMRRHLGQSGNGQLSPLPATAGKREQLSVDCTATQPGNFAQITRERMCASREDEKYSSAKSIMGKHS
jgi:hypothetical protein